MSQKERSRYHLLRLVSEGRITLKEASERSGLSYRQTERYERRFEEPGPASGNKRLIWIRKGGAKAG